MTTDNEKSNMSKEDQELIESLLPDHLKSKAASIDPSRDEKQEKREKLLESGFFDYISKRFTVPAEYCISCRKSWAMLMIGFVCGINLINIVYMMVFWFFINVCISCINSQEDFFKIYTDAFFYELKSMGFLSRIDSILGDTRGEVVYGMLVFVCALLIVSKVSSMGYIFSGFLVLVGLLIIKYLDLKSIKNNK